MNPETSLDIWLLEPNAGRTEPWLETGFNESAAVFSLDGKWLAYVSDETGEDEVYTRPWWYDADLERRRP